MGVEILGVWFGDPAGPLGSEETRFELQILVPEEAVLLERTL